MLHGPLAWALLVMLGNCLAPVAAPVPGAWAQPLAPTATPTHATRFATPEEAAAALVAAARADNVAAMHDVLGPNSAALLYSGDRLADRQARETFVAACEARHALFRILTGQGDSAPGDALNYVVDGRMTKKGKSARSGPPSSHY